MDDFSLCSNVDIFFNENKYFVGRWMIGETIQKNDNISWIKKGIDKKNGRIVALKFKQNKITTIKFTSNEQQSDPHQSQIKTEIKALKCLKHENIIHLLAYNMKSTYKQTNKNISIYVLEYAGGNLFDLMHFTEKWEAILARTYFRQFVSAINYMHNMGIIHRNLNPKNLLIDYNYNLKITGFESAKMESNGNSNILMNDWNIGTKGYQAPEILLKNKPYNKNIDVFAMGVILFILLGGYPPFEQAKETDKWYKFIVHRKYKNFWKSHRNCGLRQAETDLITRMICANTEKRISIDKIKKHAWYTNNEILRSQELIHILQYRHKQIEIQRNNDPNKQKILHNSRCHCGFHFCGGSELKNEISKHGLTLSSLPPLLSEYEIINACDIFTSAKTNAFELLQGIQMTITNKMYGDLIKPTYNKIPLFTDSCDNIESQNVFIDVPNFSLEFKCCLQDLDTFNDSDNVHIGVSIHRVRDVNGHNLVKFRKISGDTYTGAFFKIIEQLSTNAGIYLTGFNSKELVDRFQLNDAQHILLICGYIHEIEKKVNLSVPIEIINLLSEWTARLYIAFDTSLYDKCFPTKWR